jgi:hypothetical protein
MSIGDVHGIRDPHNHAALAPVHGLKWARLDSNTPANRHFLELRGAPRGAPCERLRQFAATSEIRLGSAPTWKQSTNAL